MGGVDDRKSARADARLFAFWKLAGGHLAVLPRLEFYERRADVLALDRQS